jgi:hypothetical protein
MPPVNYYLDVAETVLAPMNRELGQHSVGLGKAMARVEKIRDMVASQHIAKSKSQSAKTGNR